MNRLLLSSAKKISSGSVNLTLYDWGQTTSQLTNTVYSSPVQIGSDTTWKKVLVAGPSYVGLKNDGSLWGWGLSQYGLFGLNDSIIPPSLANSTSWKSISGCWTYSDGGDHFVAVKSDGTLWAWGSNTQGQLGLGDTANRSVPTQIGNKTNWTSADAGYGYTVGVSGGTLFAWGNDNGAFGSGLGTTIRTSSPVLVGMPIHTAAAGRDAGGNPYYWSQLAFGASHAVALRSDGTVWTWGVNTNGQLGINSTVSNATPVKTILSVSATMIAASSLSSFALSTTGVLWAWGQNTNGEIGQGSTTTANYSSPIQVTAGLPAGASFAMVSATLSQSVFGILTDGSLYAWGYGTSGCIGNNAALSKSLPTVISGASFKFVSGGRDSVFAIRTDGKLFGWGLNTGGELGDNTIVSRSSPVALGGTASWTVVSGGYTSAAIRLDGSLFAWGNNPGGQLGTNDTVSRSSPIQVMAGSSFTAVGAMKDYYVTASRYTLQYLTINGDLWGSGDSFWGPLFLSAAYSSPVQVAAGSKFKSIATGKSAMFGQLSGTNAWYGGGQLVSLYFGDANTAGNATYNTPRLLGTGYVDYTSVSAGSDFALALRSTGALHAWGASTSLGLGRNVAANTSNHALGTPDDINPAGSSFTAISAGLSHGMGLTTANTLAIWGSNSNGQQGNNLSGAANNVTVSYNILPTSWTSVAAGGSHSLATDTAGALWGWGSNSFGQLGNNSTADQSSPVLIDAGSWSLVAAGNSFSFGIKTNSTIWGWGGSAAGQTGFNDTASRSSPVQISSLAGLSFTAVAAKAKTVFALSTGKFLYSWGDNTTTNSLVPGNQVLSPTTITTSIADFDINDNHIVALKADGTMWAWGNNSGGQIGDSTTSNRSSPVQIGSSSWAAVAAGSSYSLALRSDNSLFGWGNGTFGFGDNTIISKSSPVQLSGVTSWKQVVTGNAPIFETTDGFTAALRSDGILFVWGQNANYVVGDNTNANRSSPTLLFSPYTGYSWSALAAGRGHLLALRTDGTLYGWGYNTYGQLGINTVTVTVSPVQIGTSSWTVIGASNYTSFGIDVNGRMFGWGLNSISSAIAVGTIGDNTQVNKSSPVQIGIGSSWKALATGSTLNTFAAIRSDNTLWVWGSNSYGQFGTGSTDTTTILSSPVQVGTSSWSAVSVGYYHTLGLDMSKQLWAWGDNRFGQLGNNSPSVFTTTTTPSAFSGTQSYSVVSTGLYDTHMIGLSNSNMYTIGDNTYGQAGTNSVANAYFSEGAALGSNFTVVSGGNGNAFGIKSDGSLWAVGNNANAQLGHGSALSNQSSPVQIGASWRTISPAGIVLGIRDDYSLWVWGGGTNAAGQLGQNNVTNYNGHFLKLGVGYSWVSVAASQSNGYAVRSDGALFTWGDNSSGQLGFNDTVNRSLPTQLGSSSWTAVTATATFPVTVHAIRSDGQLWGWGNNPSGQLGDNSIVTRSSPVLINSTNSWSMVAAGVSFTHAITRTGALYAWGVNANGQLGDNTVVSRSTPTAILTGSSFTMVTCGYQHALAIDTAYRLFGWGNNGLGQLGDNTIVSKSSPTLISSSSSWTFIATNKAINSATAGLISTGALYTWGESSSGLLGNVEPTNPPGGTRRRSSPVQVNVGSSYKFLNSGIYSAYAVEATTGALTGWGQPTSFDLGPTFNNSTSPTVAIPTEIMLGKYSWTAVSAGEKHVAAIRSDGKLFQWGAFSAFGGFGFLQSSPSIQGIGMPTQVGYSWTKVTSTGRNMSGSPLTAMALRSDGQLFGWGYNGTGILGINNTTNQPYPVPVGFGGGEGRSIPWKDIVLGATHAIGLKTDGSIWTWGDNANGALGTNDVNQRSNPVIITSSSYSAIGAGYYTSFAIDINGRLFGWGFNSFGTVGDNTVTARSSPVLVATTSSFIAVTSGQHTLALTTANTIMGWGQNGTGSVGNGTIANISSPVLVTSGIGSAVAIAIGGATSAGISATGKLYAWGNNANGQIGDNTAVSKSLPTLLAGTNSWTAVSVGYTTVFAQTTTGTLYFWGQNNPLISGNASFAAAAYSSPVLVSSDASWTVLPTAGNQTTGTQAPAQAVTMAIKDGAVWAWGAGLKGMGSNSLSGSLNSPVVVLSGDWSWTAVSSGSSHIALVRAGTGQVYTYGSNKFGQLGQNLPHGFTTVQPGLALTISNVQSISASDTSTYAVDNTGALYAWGANYNTQLGTSTGRNATTPTAGIAGTYTKVFSGQNFGVAATASSLTTWGLSPVAAYSPPTSSTWSMIVMSTSNNCGGIRRDGSMWTWSSTNASGNLGNNSTVAVPSSYVQVGSGFSWKIMAATNYAFAAIRSDGTLWTWGSNTYGELGQGDTINRSVPTQVGSLSWAYVTGSVSGACFMGIANAGNLYSWGQNNASGILGDLTTFNRSSPVLLGTTGSPYTTVSVGLSHALAIGGTGGVNYLLGWGYNGFSQIGVGGITNTSSPVLVNTALAPWKYISAGASNSMAITSTNGIYVWGAASLGVNGNNNVSTNLSIPTALTTGTTGLLFSNNSAASTFTDGNSLFTWGQPSLLGDGTATSAARSSPALVSTNLGLQYFFESGSVAGGIDANGIAYIWGGANAGQYPFATGNLSYPTVMATDKTVSTSVIAVTGLTPPTNTYPAATHFAYLSNNVLNKWGTNAYGQQGFPYNNFVPIRISTSSWSVISAGASFSLAGRSDGLFSWGGNTGGNLGDGTTISRSAPTQILAGNFQYVAASANGMAATDSAGTLFTWGLNTNGSTGANDTVTRSNPFIIDLGKVSWSNVYAGVNHYGAKTSGNTVYMWGANTSYQLGLGSTSNRSRPTQIAGTWSTVDLGGAHSLGLDTSSKLWVWGKNTTGQLGTSNTSPYIVPTNYDASTSYKAIAAGFNSSAGIRLDNTLWTWGDNTSAALGQNSVGGSTSSPVQISVGSSFSFVALNAVGNSGSGLKIS
jgi:alpha-tubulin suppressor-like RCC1 family protein